MLKPYGRITTWNLNRHRTLPFREIIRNNDLLKGSLFYLLILCSEHFLSGIEIHAILAVDMKVTVK